MSPFTSWLTAVGSMDTLRLFPTVCSAGSTLPKRSPGYEESPLRYWLKRLGIIGVIFFACKGLVWLGVGAVLMFLAAK